MQQVCTGTPVHLSEKSRALVARPGKGMKRVRYEQAVEEPVGRPREEYVASAHGYGASAHGYAASAHVYAACPAAVGLRRVPAAVAAPIAMSACCDGVRRIPIACPP